MNYEKTIASQASSVLIFDARKSHIWRESCHPCSQVLVCVQTKFQASAVDTVGNARATNDNAHESIARALVPALERAVDQALSVRLVEVTRILGARLDAAVRDLARPQVNINTTARRSDDLQCINIDAPNNLHEEERLRTTTMSTNKFLRKRWKPEWSRRGLKYTSVTLHFSILLQAGC